MSKKKWWQPMLLIFIVAATGVVYLGVGTYRDAPPIPEFLSPSGEALITKAAIFRGQAVFQKYALMEYGSMFGDGANRGTDFTADTLHRIAQSMNSFYSGGKPELQDTARLQVQRELKENHYTPASNSVTLTDGQSMALSEFNRYLPGFLQSADGPKTAPSTPDEIRDLAAFFFWGAWVCAVQRPGETYSYTHNWPYDPFAGNTPTAPTMLWSYLGSLGIILGLGVVLYLRGRLSIGHEIAPTEPLLTVEKVSAFRPTPTQRLAYSFFVIAAILFSIQTLAGILTVHDFVGFTKFFGLDMATLFPLTITRSWHLTLALYWISACWIGGSIFVLPMIAGVEPEGQENLVRWLLRAVMLLVVGSFLGIFLGPKGYLGSWWRWLGHQGWEFVEAGRLWQGLLYGGFALWAVIVYRGLKPILSGKDLWNLPNWMIYSIVSVLLFFTAGFVSGPETNFVIADFWRWCVIHMWAEAFFEVFTTVLVAHLMVLMGLVERQAATRTIYVATLLFLGSGLLGISHNFYWNAKPVAALAIGSIFSTLQVVPLVLLTLEAWRFRQMPRTLARATGNSHPAVFGMNEVFLFLIGVNFWNFVGAGVFGFIINLPIANYYEHGTYLTVNHGHTALMGVYGNLAIAAMIFCARFVVVPGRWSERWTRCAFWSINLGLALMAVLDLFPAGILQLQATLEQGLWYSRSPEFIQSDAFQTLTWMRLVGGPIFVVGGVIPITALIWQGRKALKPVSQPSEPVQAFAMPTSPVSAELELASNS